MSTAMNFIVMLTDDQGWGDGGCFGATDLRTPNLDRLAASGAKMNQWYGGGPVCSASRASLMSGCFPWRVDVPGNVSARWEAQGLRDVPTLPGLLQGRGYRTMMSGKWHLGQAEQYRPHHRGFDEWFGFLHGCVDYYSHTFYWLMAGSQNLPPRHDLWDNNAEVFANGRYMTDLIVERALEQLKRGAEGARRGQPFYLYVPFNAPHYPMQAPVETMARFAHLPTERQCTAALLWEYDKAVGRVLDAVEELGLTDSTVVFTSADHGPSREDRNWPDGRQEPYRGGSTGGLRGAKFSVFDGGIRVPTLMRWPGVTQAGSVIDEPCGHVDLLPTWAGAMGAAVDREFVDGVDIRGVLSGERAHVDRPRGLCWTGGKQRAVRQGKWKLVENGRDVDPVEGQGEVGVRLYDMEVDRGERTDRSEAEPGVVKELAGLLDAACGQQVG